jgi:hypothetical protein
MEYLLSGTNNINFLNKIIMGYFVKSSNEEVKMGDKFVYVSVKMTPTGFKVNKKLIVLDQELLNKLIADKVIVEKTGKDTLSEVPTDIEFYIEKIAKKKGWKLEKLYNFLNGIDELSEVAALSIVLREVAIEIDKKYKDHIQDSPKIYVISLFDGRITEANKAHIKNYRNFAAFRTIEDAKIACKIVSPLLKELFKDGRRK